MYIYICLSNLTRETNVMYGSPVTSLYVCANLKQSHMQNQCIFFQSFAQEQKSKLQLPAAKAAGKKNQFKQSALSNNKLFHEKLSQGTHFLVNFQLVLRNRELMWPNDSIGDITNLNNANCWYCQPIQNIFLHVQGIHFVNIN